jgi:hypothetical protein
MEVYAKSAYDLKALKTYFRSRLSKRIKPAHMLFTYSAVIAAALGVCLWSITTNPGSAFYYFASLWMLFMTYIVYHTYFIRPVKALKSSAQIKEKDKFTFKDGEMEIKRSSAVVSKTAVIKYNTLFRVIETKDYIFIYPQKNSVFIVDKATVKNGSVADIRKAVASQTIRKYLVYKY